MFAGACDPALGLINTINVQCGAAGGLGLGTVIDVTPGQILTQACWFQATVNIPASATVNVYPYTAGAPIPSAVGGFTPLVTTTFAPSAANNGALACVALPPTVIPAGVTMVVIEIAVGGATDILLAMGDCANGDDTIDASTFITYCGGIAAGTPLSNFPFGGPALSLIAQGPTLPSPGTPPAGLFPDGATVNAFEPGSVELPEGIHCWYYELSDGGGQVLDCDGNVAPGATTNTTSASWCITVNGPQNTVSSLTCNDALNVSVDEFCQVYLSADMFLEGGPYSCYYDCYEVYILDEHDNRMEIGCDNATKGPGGIPLNPPGGGLDVGDVNPTFDVNGCTLSLECGTYKYEVYDSCNDNICWGEFTVEDKIAPTIAPAADATLNCTQDTSPGDDCTGSVVASAAEFLPIQYDANADFNGTGSADLADFCLSVGGAPPGAVVTNVTVDIVASHEWTGDLEMILTGPNGAVVELIDNECGSDDGIFATVTDNGVSLTCGDIQQGTASLNCGTVTAANASIAGEILPDNGNMSDFAGAGVAGDWCFNIDDTFTIGDGGCIESIVLNIDYVVPAAPAATLANVKYVDAAGNEVDADTPDATRIACNDVLTYTDDIDDDGCDGTVITRTWVATDEKGNTSTSTQLITVNQVGADAEGTDWFWPSMDVVDPCVNPNGDPGIHLTCGADASPDAIYAWYKAAYIACYAPLPSYGADGNEAYTAEYDALVSRFAVTKAYPYIITKDGGASNFYENTCNLIFSYDDQAIPACGADCGGNEKIIRTWTVLDWCSAETFNKVQIIHSKDNEGPTVDMEPTLGVQSTTSMTVSADPWGCVASFALPTPEHLTDNCSDDVTYTISGPANVEFNNGVWTVSGAPRGTHTFTVTAVDCCGNAGTGSIIVTVVDNTPPIAIATRDIVVGLTYSPSNPEGGSAKIYVDQINNGSHDGNCGPVKVAIRRLDGGDCGSLGVNGHDNNSTFYNFNNLPNNQQPDDHSRNDTDGGQFVKFCCEDMMNGTGGDLDGDGVNDWVELEVELGVWDDADGDGWPGSSTQDKFASTWATVRLETKLSAQISCPPTAMINCDQDENAEGILWTVLGQATAVTNCGPADVTYSDECNWDQNGDGSFDGQFTMMGVTGPETFNKGCHYGPIVRTWSIPGTTVSCEQIVIIKEPANYFSGSRYLLDVNGDYDLNGTRPQDNPMVNFPFEGDGVDLDSDNFDDFSEIHLDCLDDDAFVDAAPTWEGEGCSLIGWSVVSDTISFEDGTAGDACYKIINEYCVIDWCQYDPSVPGPRPTNGDMKGNAQNPGKWCWTVIGKLVDDVAPTVSAPDVEWQATPGTGGSGGFPTGTSCVGTGITLTATADDINSDCPSAWIKWSVLVDINNDDVYNYEYSSFVISDNPNPIPYGTDSNDNGIWDVRLGESPFTSGTGDGAYSHATAPGDELSITIPDAIPADCGEQLHRVDWSAYDGCGNHVSTTSYFTVKDLKAPTPFCVNLSTALMDIPVGGSPGDAMVELWAIDFDKGSFDNCTNEDELLFTFTDDASTVIPEFRSAAMTFTCEDLAGGNPALLTLPIYVWDGCGNRDFCLVNLRLTDNNGACGINPTGSDIAGVIMTEMEETVVDVEVMNEQMPNALMGMEMTDDLGYYWFLDNDEGMDYALSASKNDDYLNGVSTIDLVMIQRHILGTELLDSPYKMIAADINNDGAIDGRDLVELRKLILGIYTELPQNDSWRFIDASTTLDITNPWNFDETVEVYNLDEFGMLTANFIGTKVGDVNNSAIANAFSGSTEASSANVITVDFEDLQVEAGQEVEVNITGNMTELYGYQFTMATPGLQLVNITAGELDVTEANFGVFGDVITTSWNTNTGVNTTDKLFTMTFKSTVSGKLSEILALNSSITKAEAYVGSELEIVDIALGNIAGTAEFALHQNEPNPFSTTTEIGFMMPETADATMTVYDVTGKVITVIDGNYAKGYNTIELSKSDLGASGVLYYQLDSGDFTATKKMIVIE